MKNVTINKLELLKIVNNNMVKHIAEYKEAVEDYLQAVFKICKENFDIADTFDITSTYKTIPGKPISYADSYNKAIRMLELSVDDVIILSETEFDQLVMDEWNWKQSFVATSSFYKSI